MNAIQRYQFVRRTIKNSSDAKFFGKLILQAAYFAEIGRLPSSYAV
jgi:hypothetical protein